MTESPPERLGTYPGQRLNDEKRELEGQVLHKRSCGNKLLFLQLQDSSLCPEAIFSFDVYGTEVRDVRKQISVGDTVKCVGTWRECGQIMDVFSYSIQQRWADISGGASFQAPEAKRSKPEMKKLADQVDAPPPPPEQPEGLPSRRRALCKFWMSNGTCMRSQCDGFHPQGDELKEARLRWKEEQTERLLLNNQPDDPHLNKKSHAHRASVFATWLCETYGLQRLQEEGVLDIAGGRGELAFELSVKRKIPCTVLDPRCPGGGEPQSTWHDWHVSRPQRTWFKTEHGIRSYADCQDYVAEKCPLKQCQAPVETAIKAANALKDPNSVSPSEIEDLQGWEDVLKHCAVVVGLHPDQATGGVLELAKLLNRPFAVLPCCTFADIFPERRVDGRPVRSYDDLIEWLMLETAAQKDYLMFFGKNLVVFTT